MKTATGSLAKAYLGWGIVLIVIVLGVLCNSVLKAKPLVARRAQHNTEVHATKGGVKTNTEFFDNSNFRVIDGKVLDLFCAKGVRFKGNCNLVKVRLSGTVINDSRWDWDGYVISFEFAQHTTRAQTGMHWIGEYGGGDPNFGGPQPVMLKFGGNDAKKFTYFPVGTQSEVPARFFKGIMKKEGEGKDFFNVIMFFRTKPTAIPADPNSNIVKYLDEAELSDTGSDKSADIFWARMLSEHVSDYPQPLATPVMLTRFDHGPKDPNRPIPSFSSNVSVFPIVSTKDVERVIEANEIADFDPNTNFMIIAPAAITGIGVVGDPNDPLYDGDILLNADLVITGLTLDMQQEELVYFTNGHLKIIKDALVYLEGDLNLVVISDTDAPIPGYSSNYAALTDITYPQGTGVSAWLADVEADLAADPTLELKLVIDPNDGQSLTTLLDDAIWDKLPISVPVTLSLVMGEPPEDHTVIIDESVSSLAVSEAGPTTDSYNLRLSGPPSDVVTVTIVPDNAEVQLNGLPAGNPLILTFTPGDFDTPQPVDVTAVDDNINEGPHTTVLTHIITSADDDYDGEGIADILVDVEDDEIFCGQPGTIFLAADIDLNCYVDFIDLSLLALQWIDCTDPVDPINCTVF